MGIQWDTCWGMSEKLLSYRMKHFRPLVRQGWNAPSVLSFLTTTTCEFIVLPGRNIWRDTEANLCLLSKELQCIFTCDSSFENTWSSAFHVHFQKMNMLAFGNEWLFGTLELVELKNFTATITGATRAQCFHEIKPTSINILFIGVPPRTQWLAACVGCASDSEAQVAHAAIAGCTGSLCSVFYRKLTRPLPQLINVYTPNITPSVVTVTELGWDPAAPDILINPTPPL